MITQKTPKKKIKGPSSYGPGLRDCPRSRFASKSFEKFSMCSYERAGGSVPEISVGLEILPYEHFSPVTAMKGGSRNSSGPDSIVLHFLLYQFHNHKHPILINLRVAVALIGTKVIIFVFRHVFFVSRIWNQNSSPRSLAFSLLGNRAEICHMNPRRNSFR